MFQTRFSGGSGVDTSAGFDNEEGTQLREVDGSQLDEGRRGGLLPRHSNRRYNMKPTRQRQEGATCYGRPTSQGVCQICKCLGVWGLSDAWVPWKKNRLVADRR